MKAPTTRRSFGLRLPWTSTPAPGSPHTWRLTTAVRVFGLTMLVGQVLDVGSLRATGVILMALAIVGITCCAYELQTSRTRTAWVAVTEGLMVGVLIGTAGGPVEPLLLYLAVPSVVAGIRGGFVATTNTWLTTVLAFTAAEAAGLAPREVDHQVGLALTWLLIGLGSGLLGAQQTRSLRRMVVAQAPYAAAHRLVGQLHGLVRSQSVELDVTHHGRAIQEAVRSLVHASPAIVVRDTNGHLKPVASPGALSEAEEEAGHLCVFYGQHLQRGDVTAFPLRVGQHVYGAVVLGNWSPLAHQLADTVQQMLDEHAVALETALLVEDIRSVATSEERNRLARDIHDGVAQRIVALAYLVDDVSELTDQPEARSAAEALRSEITELVRELRFSVFDLRHEVEESGGLSGALSAYVRGLSTHTNLRVHLTLNEQDTQLSRRTETEVLRIAQEAICNVHKHAHAINVWVRLTTDGSQFRLIVEDDGIGHAAPRPDHYGLHTMRERATRIGALLEITARPDGGTIVTLQVPQTRQTTTQEGNNDDHQRLARR